MCCACIVRSFHAAPVTIPNYSFELPDNPASGTTWSNALNSGTGAGGPVSGQDRLFGRVLVTTYP